MDGKRRLRVEMRVRLLLGIGATALLLAVAIRTGLVVAWVFTAVCFLLSGLLAGALLGWWPSHR